MADAITKLFRRQWFGAPFTPRLQSCLILQGHRRSKSWLPPGWSVAKQGIGWARDQFPDNEHTRFRRTLVFYKDNVEVLSINDTRHRGYRHRPVSGPILDLIEAGAAPQEIVEEIIAMLVAAQNAGVQSHADRRTSHVRADRKRQVLAARREQEEHQRLLKVLGISPEIA